MSKVYPPAEVFKEFFRIFENELRKKIGKQATGYKNYGLFNNFQDNHVVKDIFQDKPFSCEYFCDIHAKLGTKPVAVDEELFTNALLFLEGKSPRHVAEPYAELYLKLMTAFLKRIYRADPKKCSAQLEELKAGKYNKRPKNTEPGLFRDNSSKSPHLKNRENNGDIYPLLNNTIYIGKVHQGKRTDHVTLLLKTSGSDELTGEIIVFHQMPDRGYSQRPEKLIIRGFFYHNSILTISFDNTRLLMHTGTLFLLYNSNLGFDGDYILHFNPIPKERVDRSGTANNTAIGPVHYTRSNKAEAKKFMDDVKGDQTRPLYVDFIGLPSGAKVR